MAFLFAVARPQCPTSCDFRDVFFKRLMLAAMAVFNLGMLIAFMAAEPSPVVTAAWLTFPVALKVYDLINIGANLWAAFTVPRNRPIALTMSLVPAASLLTGFRTSFQGGPNLFDLAFFLFGICLSVVLAHRAWQEWRTRDALKTEFETAREMQQRQVPPAVDVPGFRIESVYKPAAHVGGDFFYIRPLDQRGVLVVVGDVSGKGLKAGIVRDAVSTLQSLVPVGSWPIRQKAADHPISYSTVKAPVSHPRNGRMGSLRTKNC